MWLRRQWIIGLFGLVMMGVVLGEQGKATPTGDDAANATDATTKSPLTGNPQLDYIHDPNLPHELRGYDLSNYPFYPRLPEDLLLPSFNFTCDDRLDGFYASVPHKCQVYHNCLFGVRYDFLCANYTVFDQKNFICHYVSEVDCENSERHYDRNEELYVTTTTSTTTPAPPQIIYVERRPGPQRGQGGNRKRPGPFGINNRRPGHRRTTTTPAPVYYDDYYYDEYYDQYYDDYYNDYTNEKTTTTTTTTQRPRRPHRPQRTRLGGEVRSKPPGRLGNVFNVRDRKRPRINPPVPVGDEVAAERPRASRLQQTPPARQQAVDDAPVDTNPQNTDESAPSESRRGRPGRKPRPGVRLPKKTTTTTTTTTEAVPGEDYYDYYDYAEEPSTTTATPTRPPRPSFSRSRPGSGSRGPQNRPDRTTTTTTTEAPTTEASRARVTRPRRVNTRNNPSSNRRTPVEGAVPLEDPQETAPPQETGSQRQRPHNFRPQFPRKRPQSEPDAGTQETATVEEVPPRASGLEGAPIDTATDSEVSGPVEETSVRSRAPLRRLGQGGPGRQRSGQRARGQRRPPTPDYYDY